MISRCLKTFCGPLTGSWALICSLLCPKVWEAGSRCTRRGLCSLRRPHWYREAWRGVGVPSEDGRERGPRHSGLLWVGNPQGSHVAPRAALLAQRRDPFLLKRVRPALTLCISSWGSWSPLLFIWRKSLSCIFMDFYRCIIYLKNVFQKSLSLPLIHNMPLHLNSLNVNINYIFKYLKVNSVSL